LTTSKEAQYSANGFSLTYSLSHELSATTMLISMAAKGNTRASILPFGLDKSRIIWDPGGSIILHRLGGKPNQGNVRVWPWAYGPASMCLTTKAQGRHYEALQEQQQPDGNGHRIFRIPNRFILPLEFSLSTVHRPSLKPYTSSAALISC
jgi:hypothetical protein